MGEFTTRRLDNFVETEKDFSGNVFNRDSFCVDPRPEMVFKINLSKLFFNGFNFLGEEDRSNYKVDRKSVV